MNQNVTRAKAYSFALSVIQRLGIQSLLNKAIFTSWFNDLILNNCTVFNEYIQVKNNNIRAS